MNNKNVISVEKLNITYMTPKGPLPAVRDVNFSIPHGKTLGLVGESGSGKSSVGYAIVHYMPENAKVSGDIRLQGNSLLDKTAEEIRRIRKHNIAMVYQNPMSSLNPSLSIGYQLAEIIQFQQKIEKKQAWYKAVEMLDQVKISDPEISAKKFQHEMSGGQLQRVVIAMALCRNPDLLIMDEPTTGLDVTTEATILDLVNELKEKYHMATLFISHNLGVVAKVSDEVCVLYAGKVVEKGDTQAVFQEPQHPYTQALINCIPKATISTNTRLAAIPGLFPDLTDLRPGCIFLNRCQYREEVCQQGKIDLAKQSDNRLVACVKTGNLITMTALQKPTHNSQNKTHKVKDAANKVKDRELLCVNDLKQYYENSTIFDFIKGRKKYTKAVDGVSFKLQRGDVVGIVGESGCGKSTLCSSIAKLEKPTSGEIFYRGENIWSLSGLKKTDYMRQCQVIFQNPESSLNTKKTVKQILERPLVLYNYGSAKQREKRVEELLAMVRLESRYAHAYPRQLSGGEKQRVSIARAFSADPTIIICDEPLSALDVSVQASILNLLGELQRNFFTTYLFISHDLNVVKYISNKIYVMYFGKICESGTTGSIFTPPHHPYTKALISAIPKISQTNHNQEIRLHGVVPSAKSPPKGCRFHTRCPEKLGTMCETKTPTMVPVNGDASHEICCHIYN